jgi:hypothetical protein
VSERPVGLIALTGNRCRCTACGRVFSTPSNFDRHRSGPWEARICLDPATVGLALSRIGVWKAKGTGYGAI